MTALRRIVSAPARAIRWILQHASVLLVLMLFLAVWNLDYEGRRAVVHTERAQCGGGIRERFTLMEAWYAAAQARTADAQHRHEGPKGVDMQAADTYLAYVTTAQRRVDVAHSLIWPDPRVPGAQGPFRHPLGYGHYTCSSAYPEPSPLQFFAG